LGTQDRTHGTHVRCIHHTPFGSGWNVMQSIIVIIGLSLVLLFGRGVALSNSGNFSSDSIRRYSLGCKRQLPVD
jgi:hypothetical protein